jgi:hypothetical protein
MLTEPEHWLLSFYRSSEIAGALFFGRLARALRPGPIQADMTRHFADESQHARYWTDCLGELGAAPLKLRDAYQDAYLEAVGLPTNLMEILAVTLVFEKRVVGQYHRHLKAPGTKPPIAQTLDRIMLDEGWHIRWVGDALRGLEPEYGADEVAATLARCMAADREVYARALAEHRHVLDEILRDHPEVHP